MANITQNYNKYKPTSDSGYYGIVKAIVTRNILYMPKPVVAGYEELANPYDVQIWIPAFDSAMVADSESTEKILDGIEDEEDEGKQFFGPNPEYIGTSSDMGKYPWASVCAPIFKDQIGDKRDRSNFDDVWSTMFYGKFNQNLPSSYPAIGDIVYVMFENGNLSLPVVMGSLLCKQNEVKYKNYADHDKDYKKYADYVGYSGNIFQPLYGGTEYTSLKNLATRVEGIDVQNDKPKEDTST